MSRKREGPSSVTVRSPFTKGLSLAASASAALEAGYPSAKSSADRRVAAARVDQDLGVPLGIRERRERTVHPCEPYGAGHERGRIELAVGQHVERVAELEWRITEHEPQVELLVDRHRWAD